MNDLRIALRQLPKNPGFTAAAVLPIALAIASFASMNHAAGAAQPLAAVGQPLKLPAMAHIVPMRGVEPGGNRADLAPFHAIVGNARVVALGEPAQDRAHHRLVAADEERKGAAVVACDDRMHELGIGRLRPFGHRR